MGVVRLFKEQVVMKAANQGSTAIDAAFVASAMDAAPAVAAVDYAEGIDEALCGAAGLRDAKPRPIGG